MISVSQGVLIVQQQQSEYQVPGTVVLLFVFFLSSRLLSSSTRRRFYPQRSSGEAVVTGVVPSPRYVPSIFVAHRVQHSHCSSIFIECCYLTLSRFPLINFNARKSPYEYVLSVRIEPTKLIKVGTRITYQATGDAGLGHWMPFCLLYTSPSPRDATLSRMPSSA